MENIKTMAKNIENDVVKWFEDLHRIPELHDQLPKTTAYVKNVLEELGVPYNTYSNSGIRAVINCGEAESLASTGNEKVIAFRADMDALPVTEETGLPYASEHPGCMHACGHDAHTAMLLGTAKIFMEIKEQLEGKIVLLFQSAEETSGGAKIMIDEGCLKNPDVDMIINFHSGRLFPGIGNGQVGWKKGSVMAAVDTFNVTVKGKGGHGAYPDECIDPIPVACQMILALQNIVSREIKPTHGAVITTGELHAGTLVNIIPDTASFGGTIRTLDPEDRKNVCRRMEEIFRGIASATRTEVDVKISHSYPVSVNDGRAVDFFIESASKIVGRENMVEITDASTGTEDISYYLQDVAGSFGALGSLAPHSDGICYPHHNSKFRIAEDCLYLGAAIYAQCGADFLKKEQ